MEIENKIFDKFDTKVKLIEYREYHKKILAYHEAGHLAISYLLGIPCNYIKISYDTVSNNPISKENTILTQKFVSHSMVDHILPKKMDYVLKYSIYGITSLSKGLKMSSIDIWNLIIPYLAILYAGDKSVNKFWSSNQNPDLENFMRKHSTDLTELDKDNDKVRVVFLMNNLTKDNNYKNMILKMIFDFLDFYLDKTEIKLFITEIVKHILKKEILERDEIENILEGNKIFEFIRNEKNNIIMMLKYKGI